MSNTTFNKSTYYIALYHCVVVRGEMGRDRGQAGGDLPGAGGRADAAPGELWLVTWHLTSQYWPLIGWCSARPSGWRTPSAWTPCPRCWRGPRPRGPGRGRRSAWCAGRRRPAGAVSTLISSIISTLISSLISTLISTMYNCIYCRCSRCKRQKYCGKKCQQAHWPAHKPVCTKRWTQDFICIDKTCM